MDDTSFLGLHTPPEITKFLGSSTTATVESMVSGLAPPFEVRVLVTVVERPFFDAVDGGWLQRGVRGHACLRQTGVTSQHDQTKLTGTSRCLWKE